MDLNLFRVCFPLKSLGYCMIIVVFGIIGVSYDAVVVLTLAPHLLDGGAMTLLSVVLLALFHVLLVLLSWSYFMVLLKDPGSVPANWKMLPQQNVEDGNSVISSISVVITNSATMTTSQGLERKPIGYCDRCQNGKPPRCHHCSVCQRCVLKMDHHCLWVVNCVGAQNYKFFLLFVLYTFLETLLNTLVLLPNFINFFRGVKHHSSSPGKLAVTFLAFSNFSFHRSSYIPNCLFSHSFPTSYRAYLDAVLNLAFVLSLLCFVIMHASLVLSNTTSVEVHEKQKGVLWKYDLGWRKNIEQVFGTRKVFWLFPLFSKEDLERLPALHGIDFPTRSEIEA